MMLDSQGNSKLRLNMVCVEVIFIAVLVSLPLFLSGIGEQFGQDLNFHLMRIEGIATELQNRVFPVKIETLWMEGYGNPVSVYYGDILLYFPAILRLMGVPLVTVYKLFVAGINLFSCIIAYWGFFKVFQKNDVAFIAMAAYVTSTYRMTNLHYRAAVVLCDDVSASYYGGDISYLHRESF